MSSSPFVIKRVYDRAIDMIAALTPCPIPASSGIAGYKSPYRHFSHRNIDVLTLAKFYAAVEKEHMNKCDEPVEEEFSPKQKAEFATCKKFLQASAAGDRSVAALSPIHKQAMLDFTYQNLFEAFREVYLPESDMKAFVYESIDAQKKLNSPLLASPPTQNGDTAEESKDTAELILIVAMLELIESNRVVTTKVVSDGYDHDSPLYLLCDAFDGLENDQQIKMKTDLSDRLKGIRDVAFLLRMAKNSGL